LLDDTGRSQEAIKEYRQILDGRERMLGAEDIEVGRVRHLLGDALAASRNHVLAIEEYRQAGGIFERVLGPEDPETLLNRSNMALSLGQNREFEASEKELKDILAIRERLVGGGDASVLMTCFNLARVLAGHGKLDEALGYAKRAEEGLPNVLASSSGAVILAKQLATEIQADVSNREKRASKNAQ